MAGGVSMMSWAEIKEAVESVVHLGKTVWKYRWWDYGYELAMLDRMLELKEKHWGKHTHYVGDTYTLKRIKVLRRMYTRYEESSGIVEEHETLKKFLRAYARNLPRLWD